MNYRNEYDAEGRLIAITYDEDPKHPMSFRDEYNSEGQIVSVTYADDPKHSRSWYSEYDVEGREIVYIHSGDPEHRHSWRSLSILSDTVAGEDIHILDNGKIKVGCQIHTLKYWKENWRAIANKYEEDVYSELVDELLAEAEEVIANLTKRSDNGRLLNLKRRIDDTHTT